MLSIIFARSGSSSNLSVCQSSAGSRGGRYKRDMLADREKCPCCGKEIVAGTFEYQPVAIKPLAVEWAEESGSANAEEKSDLLGMSGRWFVRAEAPLPLGMKNSPVRPVIWLEIGESLASSIYDLRSGNRSRVSGPATLACDLPGFPGSVGSPARFRIRNQGEPAEVVSVSDQRIASLPEEPTHEQILDIYRYMWGAEKDGRQPDSSQRERFFAWWENMLGRTVHRRLVQPPPRFSGIEPGEMLFSPPLDTGGVAVMATLGCSDLPESEKKEIACWVRNPPERFLEIFSEFVYISRMNQKPLRSGYIVPEKEILPDGFSGWLLCDPWWIHERESLYLPPSESGPSIEVLGAMPLYPVEMAYATMFGPDKLIEELQDSGVDPTDLGRDPVAPELEGGL